MKAQLIAGLLLTLTFVAACNKRSGSGPESAPGPKTYSSFDTTSGTNAPLPAHSIHFVQADLEQVLAVYQELSGRSIIRSPAVPPIKITFDNATPLTRVEALQALDNVLAANKIVMVYFGTKYVKVILAGEVSSESGPVVELPPELLPDSSSFLIYVVKLKNLKAEDAVSALMPFAKLPNGLIGMRGRDLLILRDYSSNVRRMVQILEELDADPNSPGAVQRMFQKLGQTNSGPQTPKR